MLSVIMLSVIMLSVIMLNVIMLSVVAPFIFPFNLSLLISWGVKANETAGLRQSA